VHASRACSFAAPRSMSDLKRRSENDPSEGSFCSVCRPIAAVYGEPHATYRLVQSARGAIKQTPCSTWDSHFDLPQARWPALAQRINELVRGQGSMLESALPDRLLAPPAPRP
jgi:hypothetical protein